MYDKTWMKKTIQKKLKNNNISSVMDIKEMSPKSIGTSGCNRIHRKQLYEESTHSLRLGQQRVLLRKMGSFSLLKHWV